MISKIPMIAVFQAVKYGSDFYMSFRSPSFEIFYNTDTREFYVRKEGGTFICVHVTNVPWWVPSDVEVNKILAQQGAHGRDCEGVSQEVRSADENVVADPAKDAVSQPRRVHKRPFKN